MSRSAKAARVYTAPSPTTCLCRDGSSARGFQSGLLELFLDGEPVGVDESSGLPASATNVSCVYAALRDDIDQHTSTAPNFAHAVALSHLMDDLIDAAGRQRTVTPTSAWPS